MLKVDFQFRDLTFHFFLFFNSDFFTVSECFIAHSDCDVLAAEHCEYQYHENCDNNSFCFFLVYAFPKSFHFQEISFSLFNFSDFWLCVPYGNRGNAWAYPVSFFDRSLLRRFPCRKASCNPCTCSAAREGWEEAMHY